MIPNYSYMIYKCQELSPIGSILDYGCGTGEVIEMGRAKGLDVFGTEVFYAGGNRRQVVIEKVCWIAVSSK